MSFGIDRQPQAGFGDAAFLPDAGEHVDERPALRCVIEHVIDRDERRAASGAKLGQQTEPARLVAAMIMHACKKRAFRRRAD